MALLREHFRFGVAVGVPLYIALFAIGSYLGLFGNFHTLLFSFILGFIALLTGSILPDMDAPRSPVHDTLLVLFGGLTTLLIQKAGFTPLTLVVAPLFSVWVDRNYLPSHRGFIHTPEAGILFGLLLSLSLYFLLSKNLLLCIWAGVWLTLGHQLHLIKDMRIRI
ncbi:MAG: metal-dependent hydrolase [Nitrososphaerales archaeon]